MEESVVKVLDGAYSRDMAGLFPEILSVPDGDDDSDSLPGFQFKEEMVVEVMQELWKEISSPPARLPSPEGSCGASFSDSASTVMAGVEMVGGGGGGTSLVGLDGRRPGRAAAGKGWTAEVAKEEECYVPEFMAVGGEVMDGCDAVEFDDEWLSRVLSWDPLDLDD